MTPEQEKRVEDAREKQEMMIKWFEDRREAWPKEPYRVNGWTTILNFEKWFDVSVCRIKAQQPLTGKWTRIYMRFYEVKKLLE